MELAYVSYILMCMVVFVVMFMLVAFVIVSLVIVRSGARCAANLDCCDRIMSGFAMVVMLDENRYCITFLPCSNFVLV